MNNMEELARYADVHDIAGLLNWISTSLFESRPDDPVNFLINELSKRKEDAATHAAGSGLRGVRQLSKVHRNSSIRGLLEQAGKVNAKADEERCLILPKLGDKNDLLFNLQLVSATKASLGPLVLRTNVLKEKIEGLKETVKKNKELNPKVGDANYLAYSKSKHRVEAELKNLKKQEHSIEKINKRLRSMSVSIAKLLSPEIGSDIIQYEDVMGSADQEQRALVSKKCRELGNRGSLSVGEEVEIMEEGKGKRKARVKEFCGEDRYVLDLWVDVEIHGHAFQEGYDIKEEKGNSNAKGETVTMLRQDIFSKTKVKQKASSGANIRIENPEFLLLLYEDAFHAHNALQSVSDALIKTLGKCVEFILPNLKSKKRVFAKVYEKYDGDFSKITDLARCTVSCNSLRTIIEVLKFLDDAPELDILRIKDRISAFYDASEYGGYRTFLFPFLVALSSRIFLFSR